MDLAGGAYYIVGSDFVDNEDSAQYAYHEIGRYPDIYTRKSSKTAQGPLRRKEGVDHSYDLHTYSLLYPKGSCENVPTLPPRSTNARERFESDKSKHIQLLLEGVSSTELENFQSERSSLEICEISDDESICTKSCVETCETPTSEEADNPPNKSHGEHKTPKSLSREKPSQKARSEEETCAPPIRSMKTSESNLKDKDEIRFDFSLCDAQLSRCCDVPSTLPTRSFARMDRAEFERRLRAENEARKEKERSFANASSHGDSELEDAHCNTGTEIDDAVSQLAPDSEMNEVISKLMKEDVTAEFTDAGTPTKSKRHYVEPFDGRYFKILIRFRDLY
ncbi:unnamed protein product [Strongylus vulgaris]|uniref:Uncharacterized protein n=1 Tax=Strongylus vulgaris TaxID=40348 RepID=A0A3P7IIL0_STRVU|nr:unnamed protein product [Strongylus vulgaris]